jgi:dihydrodipicolinate synthase/N-acetylneuraminate lyase
LVLGVATPSLDEAKWLAVQAGRAGADAMLAMPPYYFRSVSGEGLAAWFFQLADSSPVPILVYNYPKMTGFRLEPEWVAKVASHPNVAGFKDSSGDRDNLSAYRQAAGDRMLFVGDETLLIDALRSGWTGAISGAANVVPEWMARIVAEWRHGAMDRASVLFETVLPVIKAVRSCPQPATNKAVLHALGAIMAPDPRLPLVRAEPVGVLKALRERLGVIPAVPIGTGRAQASV